MRIVRRVLDEDTVLEIILVILLMMMMMMMMAGAGDGVNLPAAEPGPRHAALRLRHLPHRTLRPGVR